MTGYTADDTTFIVTSSLPFEMRTSTLEASTEALSTGLRGDESKLPTYFLHHEH